MKQLLSMTWLGVAAFLLPGCSGYSIRPGIWEINYYNVARVDTGEPLSIPSRLAQVTVQAADSAQDQGQSDRPDVIEVVEITYLGKTDTGVQGEGAVMAPKSLFAEISGGGEREKVFYVLPKRRDRDWTFTLVGVVVSDELIQGTRLDARINEQGSVPFHGGTGSWSMKWLRDE